MTIFTGSGVALCTPFNTKGAVNYDAYEKMIRFQIENGTDAIIACGTTGEISTLYDDEHIEVARAAVAAVKAAGGDRKIPVIAGAGGNDTRHTLEMAKRLEKEGIDGCMLVTPYYNKTSQRGLVEHFSQIASAVDLPIIVYNVPSRTSLNVLPKTAYALSKVENIVAIKEASGNIAQVADIVELCCDTLDIYSGNDEMVVPILSLGGKGVISTVANIAPRQTHEMVMKFLNGDVTGSAKIQIEMLSLIRALFSDVNPMPVKTALNLMGFEAGPCRAPLTTLDDDVKENLKMQMQRYGLPVVG